MKLMKRSVYSFRHIRNLVLVVSREHIKGVSHYIIDKTWNTDDFFIVYLTGYFKPGTKLRKKVSEKIGLEVLKTGKGAYYSITCFLHEPRIMEEDIVKIKALKCVLALRVEMMR